MNKIETVTKSLSKKVHVCDVCKKVFGYKISLTRHMLAHTYEKDFQCYVCLKRIAQKDHFAEHLVTHTKEKKFTCEVCKKEFY